MSIPASLTFRRELTAYYSGQQNYNLLAYDGDQEVGLLQYTVFRDVPSISWIETPLRKRAGVATALVCELQRLHAGIEIQLGMLTQDGAALRASLATAVEPVPGALAQVNALERVEAKLADLSFCADQLHSLNAFDEGPLQAAAARQWISTVSEPWNSLHEQQHDLESNQPASLTRTLVLPAGSVASTDRDRDHLTVALPTHKDIIGAESHRMESLAIDLLAALECVPSARRQEVLGQALEQSASSQEALTTDDLLSLAEALPAPFERALPLVAHLMHGPDQRRVIRLAVRLLGEQCLPLVRGANPAVTADALLRELPASGVKATAAIIVAGLGKDFTLQDVVNAPGLRSAETFDTMARAITAALGDTRWLSEDNGFGATPAAVAIASFGADTPLPTLLQLSPACLHARIEPTGTTPGPHATAQGPSPLEWVTRFGREESLPPLLLSGAYSDEDIERAIACDIDGKGHGALVQAFQAARRASELLASPAQATRLQALL